MKTREDSPRRRLLLLGVALLVMVMAGQEVARAEDDAAVFFIETIAIETERLSPEIVLSESLLREGREYSEPDLRQAVHRINQLPFVLLAEFSLAKGSERGRYELRVKVYETRRWFFRLGGGYDLKDPYDRFTLAGEVGARFRVESDELDALVGRRFAIGRRGLLFASIATEEGLFALGYQRYNLWDRNILFTLTVGGDDAGGVGGRSRAARAQLGIPLGGNHAVRLLAGWNKEEFRFFFLAGGSETRELETEIAWVFNSRDDPVLPREGSLFELGLTWSDIESRQDFPDPDGQLQSSESGEQLLGAIATAIRNWPFGNRQSVSVGVGALLGDGYAGSDLFEVEASVGHQVFLLRNLEPGRWREARWETSLSGLHQEYSSGDPAFTFPRTRNAWRLRTGITYRNGWGVFRLFVDYADRGFE